MRNHFRSIRQKLRSSKQICCRCLVAGGVTPVDVCSVPNRLARVSLDLVTGNVEKSASSDFFLIPSIIGAGGGSGGNVGCLVTTHKEFDTGLVPSEPLEKIVSTQKVGRKSLVPCRCLWRSNTF